MGLKKKKQIRNKLKSRELPPPFFKNKKTVKNNWKKKKKNGGRFLVLDFFFKSWPTYSSPINYYFLSW